MIYHVTPGEFASALNKRIQEGEASLRHQILLACRATAQQARAELIVRSQGIAFDTGHYARAWKSPDTPRGAKVLNDAPYAAIIEYGRRPGKWPNIRAIERWVRRKLHVKGKDAKGVAFAISKHIKEKGIRPKHVLIGFRPRLEAILLANLLKVEKGQKL